MMEKLKQRVTPEETLLATEGLLKGADVAILMTATASRNFIGMAYNGPMLKTGGPPLAWVSLGRSVPAGEISFAHEVGHLMGCRHNREQAFEWLEIIGIHVKWKIALRGTIKLFKN